MQVCGKQNDIRLLGRVEEIDACFIEISAEHKRVASKSQWLEFLVDIVAPPIGAGDMLCINVVADSAYLAVLGDVLAYLGNAVLGAIAESARVYAPRHLRAKFIGFAR